MFIKIDIREKDLLQQIQYLISNTPKFNKIIIKSETLNIGDIIISDDDDEEKIIIERKTISDLLSSIKDGRYEEQSYRLNGSPTHNHNIIYLIEGDVNRPQCFKNKNIDNLTIYSAMFSLNYYKGFSLFRTNSLQETAMVICNMVYKLEKETSKKPFYKNLNYTTQPNIENTENIEIKPIENESKNTKIKPIEIIKLIEPIEIIEIEIEIEPTEKDYVSVVKKIKKDNITPDNIGEIMLCQIPGISSVTALVIMEKYKNLPNLIKEIENNNNCLKDILYTNNKGKLRKINKTSLLNIVKFLLKK